MKIAVDAMGGDHPPKVVVQGAVEAAFELGIDIILVGRKEIILKAIGYRSLPEHIEVHHCEEVVQMHESPLKAVRKKKDASIRVSFDLEKRGDVDGVVSAGNSGAILAAALLTVGRLDGVYRPAIAGILPGKMGPVVLIDVGANVDCRPGHLFQFGIMACAFACSCLDMENPRVGLLSIGEEGSKGNEQVRLAHELFEGSPINFIGNVEGRDIFAGDVEIIVCDGFVGNVALKLSEGMGEAMNRLIKRQLMSSFFGRLALLFGRRSFQRYKKILDYEEYGGAPLLGVNGVGIVCHGGSSARAIKNAIELTALYIKNRVLEKMALQLKDLRAEKTFP